MKKLKAPFLAVIVILFNVSLALAETPAPPEPQPTGKSASTAGVNACGFCNNTPLPIDENLVFLVISGLLLGGTVIYKNKIKKASV